MNNITSDTFSTAIKNALSQFHIELSLLRGQYYDGASNLSGTKNGVATQISSVEKRAIYIHCYAHALDLAVGCTMKQSKLCCAVLEVAIEICRLTKFSPEGSYFNSIKEQITQENSQSVGIRTFCPTRWMVRGNSIGSILERIIPF